ncbi:MAG: tyrosine-type recombinase/integrase, partial [Planctomycetales bacterium]|nr:tyrosine-type recombinase/integrase [Planctomycetales bacterium]
SRGGRCYDHNSYRRAIVRACERAGIEPWAPNRLRHTRATELRRDFGLDTASAVLGHAELQVTQVYAEKDKQAAIEAARRTG